jgi:hypothetical protein
LEKDSKDAKQIANTLKIVEVQRELVQRASWCPGRAQ